MRYLGQPLNLYDGLDNRRHEILDAVKRIEFDYEGHVSMRVPMCVLRQVSILRALHVRTIGSVNHNAGAGYDVSWHHGANAI